MRKEKWKEITYLIGLGALNKESLIS